jgi:hypothetical protein
MRLVYDGWQERLTMRMRVWAAIFGITAGTVLAAGVSAAKAQAQSQPQPAPASQADGVSKTPVPVGSMRITFGDKSAEWTPATLAALPHQTVTVINSHTKTNLTFSGVPLIDLLQQLGLPAKPEGKALRYYLVAVGSDGYEAVYSLAETVPELHNASAIVADTLEGKPLAGRGPLQLVATGDKTLARCVRNLVAIRVLTTE